MLSLTKPLDDVSSHIELQAINLPRNTLVFP